VDAILVRRDLSGYGSVKSTVQRNRGGSVDRGAHLLPTPSQTVGPYFGMALPWPDGPRVVRDGSPGAFWIRGRVTDGAGEPVSDALIETWQADPEGRFPDGEDDAQGRFRGFGRCPTDAAGCYGILTVMPGPVRGPEGASQAAHIDVAVFARGLLRQVITRIYFPEDPANAVDPVFSSVPKPEQATLLANRTEDGYRFDIRLQGDDATAFFDL
jgi:protocatechuate 3,4-dioxygenase alpha subunit